MEKGKGPRRGRPKGETPSERLVRSHFEDLGWRVLKNGWPDFLLIDPDNRTAMGVEVKRKNGSVRDVQREMLKALRSYVMPVCVMGADCREVMWGVSPNPEQGGPARLLASRWWFYAKCLLEVQEEIDRLGQDYRVWFACPDRKRVLPGLKKVVECMERRK